MGVVYKLRPEIIDFILEKKKANFNLSCRVLARLIQEEFRAEVSKSSINIVIKNAGLSMPVGRRATKKKRRLGRGLLTQALLAAEPKPVLPEPAVTAAPSPAIPMPAPEIVENIPQLLKENPVEEISFVKIEEPHISPRKVFTGRVFLEAADYLIGGSLAIADALNKHLGGNANHLLLMVEDIIYGHLDGEDFASPHLDSLRGIREIPLAVSRAISEAAQEARYIRVDLESGKSCWLDAQMHSLFPTRYIPDSFGVPAFNLKYGINRHLNQGMPFILFNAPGESVPAPEFFALLAGLQRRKDGIINLAVLNSRFEESGRFSPPAQSRQSAIFGLWPRQFTEYRHLKDLGAYRPFRTSFSGSELYLADTQIEIADPASGERLLFRGAAVKNNAADRIRLVILSDLAPEAATSEEIADLYLSRWPDPEETAADFSRKAESFTYGPAMPESFWFNELNFKEGPTLDIASMFRHYFRALDAFFRQYLLPEECPNRDFLTIRDNFYKLNATSKEEQGYIALSFELPPNYPFRNELAYACHRLNEREIRSPAGKRLWFKTP